MHSERANAKLMQGTPRDFRALPIPELQKKST
jgi:hypothetical protein